MQDHPHIFTQYVPFACTGHQIQDVYTPWIVPTVYFVVLVILGASFLLELMLAVIWDRFSAVQAQLLVDKEAAELLAEAAAVRTSDARFP
jgi:hypothetical protein